MFGSCVPPFLPLHFRLFWRPALLRTQTRIVRTFTQHLKTETRDPVDTVDTRQKWTRVSASAH